MISGVFGLLGAALCIGVASSFESGNAARFWACLIGALSCFAFVIFSAGVEPDFLQAECSAYSRFASDC